jgi:ABC-type sugar transport system permease subunit
LRVTWDTYKEYFGYSKHGIWSLALLVLYHFVINLNNMAVGLYLAFTLTSSTSATESPASYNIILSLIMISSVATSFFVKYLSNKIVSLDSTNS